MTDRLDHALELARLEAPDVLILDDDLGGPSSAELVGRFRKLVPEAEIILLSSRSAHVMPGVGEGLLFHGLRPVSTGTLLDVILQALPGRLSPSPRPPAVGPMVMCVDDDPETLHSLSRLLGRHGYRVSTFDHPEGVLNAIAQVAPDLVVLDVAMPGLNGRELSQQIRNQYRGLFPIVMHSARRTDADRWSGFRYGADYYLPKPCEPHQLLDVVDYYSDRLDAEERQFIETRL